MRVLDSAGTAKVLPFPGLVESISSTLMRWSSGLVRVADRQSLALPRGGTLLVMPAADDDVAIIKSVTVHPLNSDFELPAIQGEVIVVAARTGRRLGQMDGGVLTERRTAALSLLAATHLAPEPQGCLLVIGAGAQARAHVEAFRVGLGVERVLISSRTRTRAEALAGFAQSIGMEATVLSEPSQGISEAKLIVAATSSSTPVVPAGVSDTAMIIAVGAFRPDMAEVPSEVIRRSTVVVDTLEGARLEAGDLIQAAGADAWNWSQALPLVKVLGERQSKRSGPVVFKSVGHAVFDLAAARLAFADSLALA